MLVEERDRGSIGEVLFSKAPLQKCPKKGLISDQSHSWIAKPHCATSCRHPWLRMSQAAQWDGPTVVFDEFCWAFFNVQGHLGEPQAYCHLRPGRFDVEDGD